MALRGGLPLEDMEFTQFHPTGIYGSGRLQPDDTKVSTIPSSNVASVELGACPWVKAREGEEIQMKRRSVPPAVAAVALLAALGGAALAAQNRYNLKVPGGLAFSEFKGYDEWQTVAVSQNGSLIETILGNPAMIKAYKAGIPGNGKPFPDGAKMAKIHWKAVKNDAEPGDPTVPGALDDVDFMMKDSRRFADSGGWGYAVFEFDAATDTFRPGNSNDQPPQANDAKCGFACHTLVATKDYVFTAYPKR